MSLGYRVFFIHGEDVHRIAQKRFNSLYQKKTEPLLRYAGQTVVSVIVVYELVARKPSCIIRMDTQKIRFDGEGFLDEAYQSEGLHLAASRIDNVIATLVSKSDTIVSSQSEQTKETIVDASRRFDDRRWSQRHPELSGPLLKKVLKGVFGWAV